MDVTTAIVGFIFVCIVLPYLVKNKTQFYAALALVLLALVLRGLAMMFDSPKFANAVAAISILLEAVCIILLVLATGGITFREFAGEMGKAYEVMRRGETEKTVIIPRSGQQPKRRDEDEEEPRPPRTNLNNPPKPTDSGQIPLE